MSEIYKIIITSCLTIAGGVLVYVLGQIVSLFVINPIHKLKEVIGDIADSLIYYANVYSNPGTCSKKMSDEASQKLRQVSTNLQAKVHLVPFYNLFAKYHIVPRLDKIQIACTELIGLSNSIYPSSGNANNIDFSKIDYIIKRRNKIAEALGLNVGE